MNKMMIAVLVASSWLMVGTVKSAPEPDAYTFTADTLNAHDDSTSGSKRDYTIRLFVDCAPDCYLDYIKSELTSLNFVRDKELANLHMLITGQPSGNGGYEHTLTFIGLQEFSGMLDTLTFFSQSTDTDDMLQRRLLRSIKLGLVRYLAKTTLADQTDIHFAEKASVAQPTEDRWNNWVFATNLNAELTGQKSTSAVKLSASIFANRITQDWKIRWGVDGSYSENEYSISDGTYKSLSRSEGLTGLVARSVDEHWSVGFFAFLSSSIYDNTRMWLSIAPALEYDIFPYSESTRRQCRLLYRAGYNRLNYFSETIYYQTDETLYAHSLSLALDVKEPWGRASVTMAASQYLHDLAQNRLELLGEASIRITEGFSLYVSSQVSLIHDQLFLPSFGASPEEILLQRRELSTSYYYYTSVGLSYTFGSIYSYIVNPRFGK